MSLLSPGQTPSILAAVASLQLAGATSALVALGAALAIARPKEKIALLLDIEDIALNKASLTIGD